MFHLFRSNTVTEALESYPCLKADLGVERLTRILKEVVNGKFVRLRRNLLFTEQTLTHL